MKPNVIVALLLGLVLGFVFGQAVKGTQGAPTPGDRAPRPEAPMTDESSLAIRSSEMPAGTFTGMTDVQKIAVMRLMNEHNCECGCGRGTLANCIKTDPSCPNSPAKLKQLVALARQEKTYEQMSAEMFGGAAGKPSRPSRPPADMTTVFNVPLEDSPSQGKDTAPVTLVEFSDYQCPYCSQGHATVQQLQMEYGDKLRVVMKQNPLDTIHPQARGAAKAALSAGAQGKYWEMHDKMFENQRTLDPASLERFARQIGLDMERFNKDMENPRWDKMIARDQALAAQLQASSTPQFFINGRHIAGARDISVFRQVIDEELGKVEEMLRSGVEPGQVYAKLMESAATTPPPRTDQPAAPAAKKVVVPDDAPVLGPRNAKVTIVEFSDFECPYCQRALPALKQLMKAYPKDVRLVFRQYPLPATMHPNAQLAAEASLAAHEQGKFWAMHDKMFENQRALTRPDLERYASEIGLDTGKLVAALDSGKLKQKVAADMAAGSSVGVNGTPTFFINGQEVVGGLPFDQWKARVEEEIKKADRLLASGVKPEDLYEKLMGGGEAPAPVAKEVGKEVGVGSAPTKGPRTAPVTIVEYSDFQCPYCSQALGALRQLEQSHKDKFRIAFKHLPLQSLHPDAQMAAEASMAAHEQGKFWEYHDRLFVNQRALDRASLERYAQESGLDVARFKTALDTGKFKAVVAADSAEATRLGVTGTPTFFVNGRMVQGASYARLASLIDEELAKSVAHK